jgi:phage terminase Nu1 subunit (DNA packaging protein)
LANRIGASTRTVGNLAARGVAVRGPNGRGFYLWASVRNAFKELRGAAAGRASVSDERRRVLTAQAIKLEFENNIANGKYTDTAATGRWFADILSRIRGHMLAIPDRTIRRLPHLTNHDRHEIDQEIRAALVDAYESEKALATPERAAEALARRDDDNDKTNGATK